MTTPDRDQVIEQMAHVAHALETRDGDDARVLTYARVHHIGAYPIKGSSYEYMGEYDDRWLRTTAGWKLHYRHFEIQIGLGDFALLRGADA